MARWTPRLGPLAVGSSIAAVAAAVVAPSADALTPRVLTLDNDAVPYCESRVAILDEISNPYGFATNFKVKFYPHMFNFVDDREIKIDMDDNGTWDHIEFRPPFDLTPVVATFDYAEPPPLSTSSERIRMEIRDTNGGLRATAVYDVTTLPTPDMTFTSPEGDVLTGYVSPDGVYDRPVVIVEGIDTSQSSWPSEYFGRFKDAVQGSLLPSGADVFVHNYADGGERIQDSAMGVLGGLMALSQDSVYDTRVLGVSMGGVATRYALAWAEQNGYDHGCDMFVSADSPQQGAWLNTSFQNWIADLPFSSGTVATVIDELSRPASLQLLRNNRFDVGNHSTDHLEEIDGSYEYELFFNELNILNGDGYPDETINIGVSNGYGDVAARTMESCHDESAAGNCEFLTLSVEALGNQFEISLDMADYDVLTGSWQPAFDEIGSISGAHSLFSFWVFSLDLDWTIEFGDKAPAFVWSSSALDLWDVEWGPGEDKADIDDWGYSKFDELYSQSHSSVFHDEVPASMAATIVGRILSGPVTVQTPSGTESCLFSGNTIEIAWTLDNEDLFDTATIEFSDDGGSTWSTITTVPATQTTYDWTLPVLESSNCFVRVTATGPLVTASDESDEAFEILEDGTFDVKLDGTGDFTSIQDAIDASCGAMTIQVWPGTYADYDVRNGNFSCAFMNDASVVAIGVPGDVVIDGSAAVSAAGANDAFTVLFESGDEGSIEGFEIRNGHDVVHFRYSDGRVANCELVLGTTGISTIGTGDPTIENNVIRNQGHTGIFVDFQSGPTITNNLLRNQQAYGIHFESILRTGSELERSVIGGAEVTGNTIVSSRRGIRARHIASDEFARNIVTSCITYGVSAENGNMAADFTCNNVFGNTTNYDGVNDPTGTEDNISDDPMFCDVAGHDYGLKANSPCTSAYSICGEQIGAFGVGCAAESPSVIQAIGFETQGLERIAATTGAAQGSIGGRTGIGSLRINSYDAAMVAIGKGGSQDLDNTALGLDEAFASFYVDQGGIAYNPVPIAAFVGATETKVELVWRPSDERIEVRVDGVAVGGSAPSPGGYFRYDITCRTESAPGAGDGFVEARFNGDVFAYATGLSTGAEPIDYLVLGHATGSAGSIDLRYDDVMIADERWLHTDHALPLLTPNANGTYSGWNSFTPHHWTMVDDLAGIGGYDTTTYVYTTLGMWQPRETFHLQPPSAIGIDPSDPIGAVVPIAVVKDNLALTRARLLFKSGSTEVETSSNVDLAGVYDTLARVEAVNPATGLPWTGADLDDLEVGMRDYTSPGPQIRLTAVGMLAMTVSYDGSSSATAGGPSVDPARTELPAASGFLSTGPNPARSHTSIAYAVAEAAPVTLRVMDVRGRLVRELADGVAPAGVHEIAWDLTDGRGGRVAPGVYFYDLRVGNLRQTRKLVTTH